VIPSPRTIGKKLCPRQIEVELHMLGDDACNSLVDAGVDAGLDLRLEPFPLFAAKD